MTSQTISLPHVDLFYDVKNLHTSLVIFLISSSPLDTLSDMALSSSFNLNYN